MERLTKRNKEGVAYWNGANGVHYSDNQGNIYGNAITKLAEYEDAEEQGLLIRLPCKIGDEVYQIAGYCWDCSEQTDYCHLNCEKPKYRIRKFIVNHFEVDEKNAIEIHGRLGYSGILGETVFLTREEAEAALAEMNKKENINE